MTIIEILTLLLTFTSNILLGNKNLWGWILALIVNCLWIYIGIDRQIQVIMLSSLLFLFTNMRGLYKWRKD